MSDVNVVGANGTGASNGSPPGGSGSQGGAGGPANAVNDLFASVIAETLEWLGSP